MIDDSSVYKLPDLNYTPLDSSFFTEQKKRKLNIKLLLLPILLLAATPLVFYAYQNSRASDTDTDLDAFLEERQVKSSNQPVLPTRRPTVQATAAATLAPTQQSATSAASTGQIKYFDIAASSNPADVRETAPDAAKKAAIDKTIRFLKLNPSIMADYAIVFATDSAQPNQTYTITKNAIKIPIKSLTKDVLVAVDASNKLLLISNTARGEELEALTTHGIGQIVAHTLSPEQFQTYMRTRNITLTISNEWNAYWKAGKRGPQPATEWNKSPIADFGEVFKSLYGNKTNTAHWKINTAYGDITATQRIFMLNNVNAKFQ